MPPEASTYERLKIIGRGGMGEVFLARQRGLHGFERAVALKRILPAHAGDPNFRRMFIAEARAMASLSHPNICQPIELLKVDDELFLVLELLEGVSLAAILAKLGRLPSEIICGIVVQTCAGLEHAHQRGIVHRDLTPSNLFLTSDGTIKILDFGVAKVKDTETSSAGTKGKRPYLSPEQVNGQAVDGRSDLFALGAVGIEALTGRMVFERETDYLTYRAILDGTRPTGLTPSPIEPWFARCLEVDPKDRPASARDLAQGLRAAQPGGGASPLELQELITQQMGAELAAMRELIASSLAADDDLAPENTIDRTVATMAVDQELEAFLVTSLPSSSGHTQSGWATPVPLRRRRRIAWIAGASALTLGGIALFAASVVPRKDGPDAAFGVGATAFDASAPPDAAQMPDAARADAAGLDFSADAAPVTPVTPVTPPGPPDAAPLVFKPVTVERRPDKLGTGTVSIDAVPFAQITIDGKKMGPTPLLRLPLTEGKHRVRAVTEDGRTKKVTIHVRANALTVERIVFP